MLHHCGRHPGKKYENTRHNMGFLAVDLLAEKYDIRIDKIKFKALVGEGRIAGQKVLLVKPQTFMNLSGQSIVEIMNFYKEDVENLIVIYDDIDIPTGTIRIRKKAVPERITACAISSICWEMMGFRAFASASARRTANSAT